MQEGGNGDNWFSGGIKFPESITKSDHEVIKSDEAMKTGNFKYVLFEWKIRQKRRSLIFKEYS